ncbi:MAG TPA: helix-turn-helix domain-containing protein [Ilumatobacteraceae bacterium]|jgi:DNA-binding IclR family transcriptional regulator
MSRPALSATRALTVLDFLAAHPADGFTLSDLTERLGVNAASMHAILGALAEAGYVTRNPRLRTYALGLSSAALGSAALESHPAIDLARDAARELSAAVELEVAVTAVAGNDVVFLARAGAHRARGIAVHVGQRVALVPPLGSVFVAWQAPERIDAWIGGSTDAAHARAVLAHVRDRGYSIAVEADARRGLGAALDHLADAPLDALVRGSIGGIVDELGRHDYQLAAVDPARAYDVAVITAPVFDASGQPLLALTLLGFDPGLSGRRVIELGERIRDAGLVITKQSRGRIPTR